MIKILWYDGKVVFRKFNHSITISMMKNLSKAKCIHNLLCDVWLCGFIHFSLCIFVFRKTNTNYSEYYPSNQICHNDTIWIAVELSTETATTAFIIVFSYVECGQKLRLWSLGKLVKSTTNGTWLQYST